MSLITVPVFINRLGATSYGVYVLIQSLLGVTGLFNLGFGEAAIKFVAEADGRGDTPKMMRYFRNTLAVSLVVTAVVFALLLLFAGILSGSLLRAQGQEKEVAVIALTWFGVAWMGRNINGALSTLLAAKQRYDRVVMIREGAIVLDRVLSLTVLTFGGGLVAVFQSQIVSQLISGVLFVASTRQIVPGASLIPRFDAECLAQSFRFGVWQALASVFYEMSNSVDRWMIGALVSTRAVGYYGAIQVVTNGLWGILSGLASVLIPTFSYLQGRGEEGRSTSAFMTATWLLGLVGTLLTVPLVWYGRPFLRLWIGAAAAQDAYVALVLSLVAQTLLNAAAAQVCFLIGTGRTAWMARIALANIVLTTAINGIALPVWGMDGMGASRIGVALCAAFNLLLMRSHALESPPRRIYFGAIFGPSAIGLVCSGIGLAVSRQNLWFDINTWGWLALAATLTALGVAGLNLFVGHLMGDQASRLRQLRRTLGWPVPGPAPS